jgi:hypothetical protein
MAPSRPSTATKPAKRTTGKRGRAKEYGRAKRAYAKSGKGGIRHRARAGASGAHGYSLVARFLNTSGKLVLDDLSRSFGMSKGQLAETAGIRPETLHRKQRALAPKTQNRLREMLEILGRVADWAGSERIRRLPGIAPSRFRHSAAARPKPSSRRERQTRCATIWITSRSAASREISRDVLPGARSAMGLFTTIR